MCTCRSLQTWNSIADGEPIARGVRLLDQKFGIRESKVSRDNVEGRRGSGGGKRGRWGGQLGEVREFADHSGWRSRNQIPTWLQSMILRRACWRGYQISDWWQRKQLKACQRGESRAGTWPWEGGLTGYERWGSDGGRWSWGPWYPGRGAIDVLFGDSLIVRPDGKGLSLQQHRVLGVSRVDDDDKGGPMFQDHRGPGPNLSVVAERVWGRIDDD